MKKITKYGEVTVSTKDGKPHLSIKGFDGEGFSCEAELMMYAIKWAMDSLGECFDAKVELVKKKK